MSRTVERRGSTLTAVAAALCCAGSCAPSSAPRPSLSTVAAESASTPAVLDDFESLQQWTAKASDDVLANADGVPGATGQALRLSFDFQGHGGHAGVGRTLPLRLPDNYEISFAMRGTAPRNDLQFKLLDASGDNVWWYRQRDMAVSDGWQRVRFKKRQLEFAWGPTRDRELRQAAGLELVIAAGEGGRGSVQFDDLTIRELPLPPAVPPVPLPSASSNEASVALVLDGRIDTAWRSAALQLAPGSNAPQGPSSARAEHVTLDLGYGREFGGLIVRWAPGAFASRYDVELSNDGQEWRLARQVRGGNGERDALLLTESEARYVRLRLLEGPAATFALAELEVKDLAFGATQNAFVSALAREAPRGRYPRAYVGEQSYWTLVGVDGGSDSGLLSEDGALELRRGGVSVEPFVVKGSDLVTWADVELSHSLADGYLPIPSVTWKRPDWELSVTAFATGDEAHAELGARYELTNRTQQPLELTLLLAVRPLQVNPPTQFLNQMSGFSPIHQLGWDGRTLSVNGAATLLPLVPPARVHLTPFDAAEFPERRPSGPGQTGSASRVDDPTGMATGVFEYPVSVPAGGRVTVGAAAPLLGKGATAGGATGRTPLLPSLQALRQREASVAARWREQIDRVAFEVPPEGRALVDTLRSSLAHILLSRVGAMLRPGTRSYARSWIRDGAMMSESLLRLGHEAAAAEYFDFYAPRQFAGGKVPCCVDARGADPVPEHDSPGELIFLAAELHRFTRDRVRLERGWPHVLAAAEYLESLRQEERTAKNQTPERRHLYGLLPPSISHEGYSDKPAYSYWDNFWALIGYQDAAWLARAVGDGGAHERLSRQRDEFHRDLYASLQASAARHEIPFLPGAADRGDFDATSTTIALAPGREGQRLPRDLLLGTFERYWDEFSTRRAGSRAWDAYTPYELRVAGTFIRLGWRERAQVLFDYFMADRRPAAWNQWAEVVGRDAREPRFIGDMPHAWISSDYIRSVLDMFAYARDSDQSLVLAAGIPASWLDRSPVAVRGLRTPHGVLDFEVMRAGAQLILTASGATPPGGCVVPWPWTGSPAADARVTINGQPARWNNGEVRIPRTPARVVIDTPRPN